MSKNLVLVLNCGSSSIKFAILNPKTTIVVVTGLVQQINTPKANIKYTIETKKYARKLPNIDYQSALATIVEIIQSRKDLTTKLAAIGHRVVHGGEKFTHSVMITKQILKTINSCANLAPLHNPANILGIEATKKAFPKLKQVAVFDTAFHQSLPAYAYIYPVPYEWYKKYSIRRYGFHGTSHRFVASQAAKWLNQRLSRSSFITAHLGNGCSVAAIANGKSLDTSMGLTPLEGLMMGTRSGDIDPSIYLHLANNLGYNIDKITTILNQQSGLLGVSGIDSDMRAIENQAMAGNQRAKLALEIFCYRLAKYICALIVPLGKLDALIFTGGIGENSKVVREKTLHWLKFLGFKVASKYNQVNGKGNQGVITTKGSPIAIVVPTNEELLIAQDTIQLSKN